MIPLTLIAETIWQQQEGTLMSIESLLGWLAGMVGVGGLIMLIVVSQACTRLGNIERHQNATNLWLKKIVEGRGTEAPPTLQKKTAGDTPAATPMTSPALAPPLPKTEPEVYRI